MSSETADALEAAIVEYGPSAAMKLNHPTVLNFIAGYKAAAESLQPRLNAALKLLNRPEVMAVLGLEELPGDPKRTL